MRAIQAAREYNRLHDAAVRTIGIHAHADRGALFVREADEVYLLDDACVHSSPRRGESQVDVDSLAAALKTTRADAVWAGWGSQATSPALMDLCGRLGIPLIGSPPPVVARVSQGLTFREVAEAQSMPLVPWSAALADADAASQAAARQGMPAVAHVVSDLHPRQTWLVRDAGQWHAVFAAAAAVQGSVYLERPPARHRRLTVPVIVDRQGTCWLPGIEDTSVAQGLQPVLVETPVPGLDAATATRILDTSCALVKAMGFQGVGVLVFLLDVDGGAALVKEMHAHPLGCHAATEMRTGLDLVQLQFHLARGGTLDGTVPAGSGHAVHLVLQTQSSEVTIAMSRIPTGTGLRVDGQFTEHVGVVPDLDGQLAVFAAQAPERARALSRLGRALEETVLLLARGSTSKRFLQWLLDRPEVGDGGLDAHWLDRQIASGGHLQRPHSEVAVLQAALEQHDQEARLRRSRFFESAVRLQPEVDADVGYRADLAYRGHIYRLQVYQVSPGRYRILVDQRALDLLRETFSRYEHRLQVHGRRYRVLSIIEGLHHHVEVDGILHTVSHSGGKVLRAPSPAVVVKILVEPGDVVSVGDPLLVLETMKMETTLVSDMAGRVREVSVISNTQVGSGTPLLRIESEEIAEQATAADLPQFGEAPAETTAQAVADLLRYLALGYDVPPEQVKTLVKTWLELPFDAAIQRHETEFLQIFSDVNALFRRANPGDPSPGAEELLHTYLRHVDRQGVDLPPNLRLQVVQVLSHYGIRTLDHTDALEDALYRMFRARRRVDEQLRIVMAILERWLKQGLKVEGADEQRKVRTLLDSLVKAAQGDFQTVSYLARELRFQYFDDPLFEQGKEARYRALRRHLEPLSGPPGDAARQAAIQHMLTRPYPLIRLLRPETLSADGLLELITLGYYRDGALVNPQVVRQDGQVLVVGELAAGQGGRLVSTFGAMADAAALARGTGAHVAGASSVMVDLYLYRGDALPSPDALVAELAGVLAAAGLAAVVRRVAAVVTGKSRTADVQHFTFVRAGDDGWQEDAPVRGVHPEAAARMGWQQRLQHFERVWIPTSEDIYLSQATARTNNKDVRLMAIAEVYHATAVRDAHQGVTVPEVERTLNEAVSAMRKIRLRRHPDASGWLNWVLLYIWPPLDLTLSEIQQMAHRLAPDEAGLEAVVSMRIAVRNPQTGEVEPRELLVTNPEGAGASVVSTSVTDAPLEPLNDYQQKVLRLQQRGLMHPYEIVRMLANLRDDGEVGHGTFVEYDVDEDGHAHPVNRPSGMNRANIVVGVITNYTRLYPEGITRVILLGDPSRSMGSVAEPECRRIMAALELAEEKGVPLEWFALSAGAKISMDTGVENMDWVARVLRKIITFTQAGGEINIVVDGINVGAQPYWNAEATMLMHCRGILIMTPRGAMVLTGKKALDYSGSVSAEDNIGTGGYNRIMGPNGQAQYWTRNLREACQLLLQHYGYAYRVPGERFPRRAVTADPAARDVRQHPYRDDSEEHGFQVLGDVFSIEKNPGRKKPFDVRQVMGAVVDQDLPWLERWSAMAEASSAVVWDAYLGGYPVCVLGFESKPLARQGFIPADGPSRWTSGTLFPQSSRKVARAINSASGNRPVVVLANLSGFDGSPESMRRWQLEYGAEIGRAVVNFKGPVIFCVISRYHGGAYVVFSRYLNENMQVSALEGSFASVIGGAPAAAVVFASEVEARTQADPRLADMRAQQMQAEGIEKVRLRATMEELYKTIYSEKLGEVAEAFDAVHNVHRALEKGALDAIIPASSLRPHLIEAVTAGIRRELERDGAVPLIGADTAL